MPRPPVAHWLPSYRRSWLAADTVAGLTVWALVVPEAMAYAALAGVPIQYGLYSVPLALIGYVVFGGSRRLFVGPSASVATLSATAVGSVVAADADPGAFIAATAALALLVGVIYLVLGLLRMGFIARFFAKPVLDGFIVGLGLFVAIGQLPKLVGIEKPSGNSVRVLIDTITAVGDWGWVTVAVGVTALVGLFAMARFAPRAPGALIAVAVSIVAVRALDLGDHGVALVGNVPTGFHFVSWSQVGADEVFHLLPGALAIVVVGFAQSVAIAKALAAKDHTRVDATQEMFGYGAANLGAGALQGYTVTGSLSKSAAAEQAGGRSPALLAVAAGLVVLTVIFLAGLFERLPETVLAAVVLNAVAGMIGPAPLVRLWQAHLGEFWLAAGTLAGVLVAGILPGVVIGVAASFILLIRRLDHPSTTTLGRTADGRTYAELESDAELAAVPGLLIYAFRAPLVFANAEVFIDDITARVAADGRPTAIVLDCGGIAEIDTTGDDALRSLHATLEHQGIELMLARVNAGVRDLMRRDGLLDSIGEDAVFVSVHAAVAAAEAARPAGGSAAAASHAASGAAGDSA
jgi:SulP family sulfate permease